MSRLVCLSILGALLVGFAAAETFEVPLDPGQSSLEFELCIAGSCDTDSSAISGPVTIELDSVDSPTQVWLHDFHLAASSDLHWHISWGILGSFDADATGLLLNYANPGLPMGPEPVVGGVFSFLSVPASMEGTYSYTATGVPCWALELAGRPCNDTQNLADMGTPIFDEWSSTISSQDRVVTLTSAIDVTLPLDPNNPDLGTLSVYGSLQGQTYVPMPGDVDGDGDVDLSDLAGVLGAYGACTGDPSYNPAADFDDSGCVDLSDLATLLGNYGYGT